MKSKNLIILSICISFLFAYSPAILAVNSISEDPTANCDCWDNTPPRIGYFLPAPDSTGVDPYTWIRFFTNDYGSGVDPSSMKMEVNGEEVFLYKQWKLFYWKAWYAPEEPFQDGEEVQVSVEVCDRGCWWSGIYNCSQKEFSFVVGESAEDNEDPFLANMDPAPDQENVPSDTSIYLEVLDEGVGVNPDTIQMFVDDVQVNPDTWEVEQGYALNYDGEDFEPGSTVSVQVEACDWNDNCMVDNYEFFIYQEGEDTEPPVVEDMQPSPGDTNVPVDTNISLKILDFGSGVDLSTVVATVQGEEVAWAIESTENGYFFEYDPEESFELGEVVEISVFACDLAANCMDTFTYQFTIREEGNENTEGTVVGTGWIADEGKPESKEYFNFVVSYDAQFPNPYGEFEFYHEAQGFTLVSQSLTLLQIDFEAASAYFEGEGTLEKETGYTYAVEIWDADYKNEKPYQDQFGIVIYDPDGNVFYEQPMVDLYQGEISIFE